MSVDRERRIFELLDEALGQPDNERSDFLDKACGDDEELRQEVESLLDTQTGDGVLATPAFSVHADDPGVGRKIEHYRLIELLGRGGMGAVYLAEHDEFEQQVALKVIRRGLDLDEHLVRRFRNERQILARLEHPYIARLLDGGASEDGLPYFAMEHVEGLPIHHYCRDQALSVEDRLQLFRKVCAAVQFAHQNLVIHRDLKPSNILITAEGEPRLLDFGIAKLLDDGLAAEHLTTIPGGGAMTPRYASPEQVQQKSVTTASDVYSLGVLLYELLTGVDPYDLDGESRGDEVARAVCDTEPERPSTAVRRRAGASVHEPKKLQRRLSGDLDSIVLKAMRKEPELRYGSVEQLSDDIRRHLDGLPVEAQTGTFFYRAGKLVRRHLLGVVITLGFFLISIVFGSVSTYFFFQADEQRELAERQRERAEKLRQSFISLFRFQDPDSEANESEELLGRGRDLINDELSDHPEDTIYIAGTLGDVLRRQGDFEGALEMMEIAIKASKEHFGDLHSETIKRLNNLGALQLDHGQNKAAERSFREALENADGLGMPQSELVRTISNLATSLMLQDKFVEAEGLYRVVLGIRLDRASGRTDKDVATTRRSLGALYLAWQRLPEAEKLLNQALDTRLTVYGENHTSVASVKDLLGRVMAAKGNNTESEKLYRDALRIRQDRLPLGHRLTAKTQKNLADLMAESDPTESKRLILESLETFRRTKRDTLDRAEAESILGKIHMHLGQLSQAKPLLTSSLERIRQTRGKNNFRTQQALRRLIAFCETTDRCSDEELASYKSQLTPENN